MTDDGDSTELIDEEGRLFGYVNVIDALVVLLVLAVGIAGAALVVSSSAPGGTETTNATIDLGMQPNSVASAIDEGDVYDPRGASNMTITDVYRVPEGDGQRTLIRANLTGDETDEGLTFDGAPPRLGRNLTISPPQYNVTGTITATGAGETLQTTNRTVVLRTTLPTNRNEEFVAGQRVQIGDQPIAMIDDVVRYNLPDADRTRLTIEATLRTYTSDGLTRFGGTLLQEGATIRFPGEGTLVSMNVERVGDGFERQTTTVRVTDTVTAEEATIISGGDEYLAGDQTIATIADVVFYDTGQPGQREMYATLDLKTLTIGDRPQFGGTLVRQGATVSFQTEAYELAARIERVGTGIERSTTNVLVTDTVTANEAATLSAGDSYLVGGQTVGTLESVAVYDTGQPDRKAIYATLSLETLALGDRPRFGSTLIRQGASVPFETENYELDARIERVERELARSTTTVLVTDTVDADDAAAIAEGDQYIVAGQSVATVESVDAYGTGDPAQRQVYVGLALETVGYGELPRFGSTIIQKGASIPFQTEAYELDGQIQRIGTTEQPGTPTTVNATLEIDNVDPSFAESIRTGLTETSGDRTVARVTSVERENATVVLTSDDGQIYMREHPVNQDVTITVELAARTTDAGIRFKGDLLQQGSTIRLDLGTVTVEGELIGPIRDT